MRPGPVPGHPGWAVSRGQRLSRGSERRDRWSTAVHEAGHAVIGELLGGRVRRLWLGIDARNGMTETFYPRRGRRPIDPIMLACSHLAGHEAEVRLCGRPPSLLPHGDLRALDGMGIQRGQSLNAAGRATRDLVRWHERAIRRVAKALLAQRKLSRSAFLAALQAQP